MHLSPASAAGIFAGALTAVIFANAPEIRAAVEFAGDLHAALLEFHQPTHQ